MLRSLSLASAVAALLSGAPAIAQPQQVAVVALTDPRREEAKRADTLVLRRASGSDALVLAHKSHSSHRSHSSHASHSSHYSSTPSPGPSRPHTPVSPSPSPAPALTPSPSPPAKQTTPSTPTSSTARRDALAVQVAAIGACDAFAAVLRASATALNATPGPLTLFVPTDAAIRALPQAMRDRLTSGKDQAFVDQFVRCHVLLDRRTAAQLRSATPATTPRGTRLQVTAEGDHFRIGDAQLGPTDIQTPEAVVHVTDTVLPLSPLDAPAVLFNSGAEQFASLLKTCPAVLEQLRSNTTTYTILAPSDAAVEALGKDTLEQFRRPSGQAALAIFLRRQLVAGRHWTSSLQDNDQLGTLAGTTVAVRVDASDIRVGNARMLTPDVPFASGVIHIVDQVSAPHAP